MPPAGFATCDALSQKSCGKHEQTYRPQNANLVAGKVGIICAVLHAHALHSCVLAFEKETHPNLKTSNDRA